MNPMRDPETTLAAWLGEGPEELPSGTRRAILTALPTTPQARRGLLAPWRSHPMSTFARLVPAIIAVVVFGAGALYLAGSAFTGPGASPSPSPSAASSSPSPSAASPSASPSPSPSAAALASLPPEPSYDTSTWLPFTSARYGYTISYPETWGVFQRADHDWSFLADATEFTTSAADGFNAPGNLKYVSVFRADLGGVDATQWIATYHHMWDRDCGGEPPLIAAVTVDGVDGVLADYCEEAAVFVPTDTSIYVIEVWRPGNASLLRAFASTFRLPQSS